MRGFQAVYSELEALGARVGGVSGDSFAANGAFAEKNEIAFPLLSDWPDNKTMESFGVRAEGRPTADNDRSTHVAPCPATGADLWPSVTPINVVVARLGAEAVHAGLRWGGGSPVGSKDSDAPGIPSDWQHVDLGPVPM